MKTKGLIAVTVAVMVIFASAARADVLLFDNFDSETLSLNYTGFANWNVTNGTVDLIGAPGFFNLLPGNGRYVDLDGSTNQAGFLTSKQSFVLPDGGTFTLTFDLAGSQRGDTNTVDVTLVGVSVGSLTVASAVPFTLHTISLTNNSGSPFSGPLVFHNEGGDSLGALLDNVNLSTPGQSVPEPATMLLLGLGLIGVAGIRSKLRN